MRPFYGGADATGNGGASAFGVPGLAGPAEESRSESVGRPGEHWEDADVASSTDAYASRFQGAVGEWFLEVQARHVMELVGEWGRDLRILDVGGGHAQITPHLVAAGHRVTVLGSDPSCGQRLEPWLGDGCSFEVGNLEGLPYPDRSFDAAIGFRLLSHVRHWRRFVAELCRVAGGFVMLDYPTSRSVNVLAGPLFPLKVRAEVEPPRPFRVFRAEELHGELTRNGFSVAEERPQFVLPMALHRVMSFLALSRGVEAAGRAIGASRLFGSPVILRADRPG